MFVNLISTLQFRDLTHVRQELKISECLTPVHGRDPLTLMRILRKWDTGPPIKLLNLALDRDRLKSLIWRLSGLRIYCPSLLIFCFLVYLNWKLFDQVLSEKFPLIIFKSHSSGALTIYIPSHSVFLDKGFSSRIFYP